MQSLACNTLARHDLRVHTVCAGHMQLVVNKTTISNTECKALLPVGWRKAQMAQV